MTDKDFDRVTDAIVWIVKHADSVENARRQVRRNVVALYEEGQRTPHPLPREEKDRG